MVGKEFTVTDIALPVLEQPVVELTTLKVPVYVPAPGLEGTVIAIGEDGKEVLLTLVKPAMIAPAPQEILYWFGLLVVPLYVKLALVIPLQILGLLPNVMVGKAFTVPLAIIFWVVAPEDTQVILPEGVPVAEDVKRVYMVVPFTVPPDCVRVTLVVKPLPDVVDTSKPAGGVITILFVRFDPLTVKLCWLDAVPEHDAKADNVPVFVIVGEAPILVKIKLSKLKMKPDPELIVKEVMP